jgi:hypothetical protein
MNGSKQRALVEVVARLLVSDFKRQEQLKDLQGGTREGQGTNVATETTTQRPPKEAA